MSSKFYLVAAAYQKQTTHEDNKQKKHPTRHRNKWSYGLKMKVVSQFMNISVNTQTTKKTAKEVEDLKYFEPYCCLIVTAKTTSRQHDGHSFLEHNL